jgi:general stress protein 26
MALYKQDQIDLIASKIKDVRFGMFTTIDGSGMLTSRPLTTQQIDREGNMWFYTSDEAPFTHELEHHSDVNVSFSSPEQSLYLSVSGRAVLVRDSIKARELWNPMVKAWFAGGLNDPHLAMIRVQIHSAEYWDAGSSKMKQLVALAKAAITGERPTNIGEHTTICL